jgi:hypothetical protein
MYSYVYIDIYYVLYMDDRRHAGSAGATEDTQGVQGGGRGHDKRQIGRGPERGGGFGRSRRACPRFETNICTTDQSTVAPCVTTYVITYVISL